MDGVDVQAQVWNKTLISIPKPSQRKVKSGGSMKSFCRCYSLHLRNPCKSDLLPRLQPTKCNSEVYDVLHLLDIRVLVGVEFPTSALKFGSELIYFNDGVTQGSQLAMAIAQICGVYMEASAAASMLASAHFTIDFLWQRWVDDIYIVIAVFFTDPSEIIDAGVCAQDAAKKIVNVYGQHSRLKEECADEFVGMTVLDDDDNLSSTPITYANLGAADFGTTRCRFKHFFSNALYAKKCSTVLSQIYSFVDRSSCERLLGRALICLFIEFRAVGYPVRVLQGAVKKFMAKFPFLGIVREAWVNFLHREVIFWRRFLEFRS